MLTCRGKILMKRWLGIEENTIIGNPRALDRARTIVSPSSPSKYPHCRKCSASSLTLLCTRNPWYSSSFSLHSFTASSLSVLLSTLTSVPEQNTARSEHDHSRSYGSILHDSVGTHEDSGITALKYDAGDCTAELGALHTR